MDRKSRYLYSSKVRFDPLSIVLSLAGIGVALYSLLTVQNLNQYYDLRGFLSVIIGTFAILIFQHDITMIIKTFFYLLKTFLSTPQKQLTQSIEQLDQAIINNNYISDLREASKLNSEIINDVCFMLKQGLLFSEIESFINHKVITEYNQRELSCELLRKGTIIAPGMGLFGTVIGLIGVLRSLSDPSQIGPSMSLALMTTAYGAALGTLFFTPMAGRMEFHNEVYLDAHQELINKIKVLLLREERRMDKELKVEIQESI